MPEEREKPARGPGWERETLERLAFAALEEQRRARRWHIFFRFLIIGLVVALVIILRAPAWSQPGAIGGTGRFAAVVDLDGTIDAGGLASAHNVDTALRAAFRSHAVGVIIKADSPGGSPVQADEMYAEITRLRKRYPHKPIYAVLGDMCASGCYYVVAAANKIYANPSSLVGSIGVLMDGFGFVGTMKKLGVQRRLLVAGRNKGFLDPFSPMTAKDRHFVNQMLRQIHARFIEKVKQGRGAVLAKNDPRLFSGLAWTGERAKSLGLIDGFGSARTVARRFMGTTTLVNFTHRPSLVNQLTHRFGVDLANALATKLASPRPVLRY
ncbi:MAG: S49 family peptidase [Acidiferrobacteraceae bacterium]